MRLRIRGRDRRHSRSVKVVVAGPFGVGKTTLISTISESAVLATERPVTGRPRSQQSLATVAMDFGRISIDRDLVLHLFGTPGQRRLDFMWEILAEGMLGFVVLVDDGRPESAAEAEGILAFLRDIAEVPYVVGVTKSEDDPEGAVVRARARVSIEDHVRVVSCDATDKESVRHLLLELLHEVMDHTEADHSAAV
jgi:uncharacterized protein